MEQTPRQRILSRHAALTNERASFVSHWQEISDYLLPVRDEAAALVGQRGVAGEDALARGLFHLLTQQSVAAKGHLIL